MPSSDKGPQQEPWPWQELWQGGCSDMLAWLRERQGLGMIPKASLVVADPPWIYSDGAKGETKRSQRGLASGQYGGLSVPRITQHLCEALEVAAPDCYLLVWCTFPKLAEWLTSSTEALHNARPYAKPNEQRGWRYVSGGSWAKLGGMGVGHHWRGDAEVALLYTLGHPRPQTWASNLWQAPRGTHSEKPQLALRRQVAMCTKPGELVVDLYAGESGSLARACRALGRGYVGAELDPERHRQALERMAPQDLWPEEVYPLESPRDYEAEEKKKAAKQRHKAILEAANRSAGNIP